MALESSCAEAAASVYNIFSCRFGHVFTMDTGTSLGTIEGHSNTINTCSYRSARPFRIVTASEDNTVGFHEGPPFKFKRTQRVSSGCL